MLQNIRFLFILIRNHADVSALEAEIDRLVYQLYGLNEEEIAIVEGRTLPTETEFLTKTRFFHFFSQRSTRRRFGTRMGGCKCATTNND